MTQKWESSAWKIPILLSCKSNPNHPTDNMQHRMADHGIVNAVLAVQIAEQQAKAAVKQEAAGKQQRRQRAEDHGCRRQMSCGEQ